MITINELFSGIGAQVAALKRIGVKFNVVGISEIDKYAIKSYEAINGKTRNYGDISKAEALDYADLWTYSFPCTDISLAGKQEGLTDGTGKQTRSGLLFEVERLLKKSVEYGNQPKYLLLENVKNLVGKKFKPEFDKWLKTLDGLGYNNYWKVLNAKDYGVPQNRERVFVVSIRKDVDTQGYTFPEPFKLERRLKDVLETNVDEKYYLKQELVGCAIEKGIGHNPVSKKFEFDGFHENKPCPTLLATDYKCPKCYSDGVRIRKLTPKECWRLMDFTDEEFEAAQNSGVSKTQLYKQAGNSIVVSVLAGIFNNLLGEQK